MVENQLQTQGHSIFCHLVLNSKETKPSNSRRKLSTLSDINCIPKYPHIFYVRILHFGILFNEAIGPRVPQNRDPVKQMK